MICPACNQNIPDGSNYCPSCAADLTKLRRKAIVAQQQQAAKRPPDSAKQQQTGRFQPYPQQQQPHSPQQQAYPSQYGASEGGEGGIFEGISSRGKLAFAIGGLVLLAVLVLLIVKLFGGTATDKTNQPPVVADQPLPTIRVYNTTPEPTEEPMDDATDDSPLMVPPTPAPTAMPNFTLLKKGSKGEEVTRLQQRLKDLGFAPDLVVDGDYGSGTVDAVRAFQKSVGLTSDGAAGPETQKKLFSIAFDAGAATTQENTPQNNNAGSANPPG